MMHYTQRSGFTLLELSIVLVIIGLIIGGITVGQDMIRSAELQNVTKDLHKYKTAVNTFKLKYNAIPGDMDNATAYWGDDAAVCADAGVADGTPGTCNGDGDGVIDQNSEETRFWQMMTLAEIISGNYTGELNGSSELEPGVNVPTGAMSGSGWHAVQRGSIVFAKNSGCSTFDVEALGTDRLRLLFGVQRNGCHAVSNLHGGVLTGTEAQIMDQKIDDNLPGTGTMLAGHGAAADCYNAARTAYTPAASAAKSCTVLFTIRK